MLSAVEAGPGNDSPFKVGTLKDGARKVRTLQSRTFEVSVCKICIDKMGDVFPPDVAIVSAFAGVALSALMEGTADFRRPLRIQKIAGFDALELCPLEFDLTEVNPEHLRAG